MNPAICRRFRLSERIISSDIHVVSWKKRVMNTKNMNAEKQGLDDFVSMDVVVRTFAAGVWFGTLAKKSGNEIILHNARRMWGWRCKEGISISELAIHGIVPEESIICEPVPMIWIEAIEIIPVLGVAGKSIREAPYAKAR